MELDDFQGSPAASVRADSAEPPLPQTLLQGSGTPTSPPRAGWASAKGCRIEGLSGACRHTWRCVGSDLSLLSVLAGLQAAPAMLWVRSSLVR